MEVPIVSLVLHHARNAPLMPPPVQDVYLAMDYQAAHVSVRQGPSSMEMGIAFLVLPHVQNAPLQQQTVQIVSQTTTNQETPAHAPQDSS